MFHVFNYKNIDVWVDIKTECLDQWKACFNPTFGLNTHISQ